jgi:hypothetical protein
MRVQAARPLRHPLQGCGDTLLGVAEGNEREQALALVQAGEFTLVHVGIACDLNRSLHHP